MDNKMDNLIPSLEGYYSGILTYIAAERPNTSEVLHFVGALLNTILNNIKLTKAEREVYLDIYKTIIRKKISEAEVIEEEQELAMV